MAVLVQFDRNGGWSDTLVCETRVRAGLAARGIAHGNGRPPAASPDGTVRRVRKGATLFYFPVDEGWLGLLCEAGEWVAVPAAQRHWFTEGGGASVLPGALPAYDDFIERLLELTGNVVDEGSA